MTEHAKDTTSQAAADQAPTAGPGAGPGVTAGVKAVWPRPDLDDLPAPPAPPAGLADSGGNNGIDAASQDHPELGCASLEQWVSEVLSATYCRRVTGQFRWCAQWWRHAEAVVRLEALWRSWEALRLDPLLGMATWHRDYLDHQLLVLTGPNGPFADCQPDRHFAAEHDHLPLQPAPQGWWEQPDAQQNAVGNGHGHGHGGRR